MNLPCQFSDVNLQFVGSPVEQARGLLRKVKIGGNVQDALAELPASLEEIIGRPVAFTRDQLQAYLTHLGVTEGDIGGSLSAPLSKTLSGKRATYFVIHDTSDELAGTGFLDSINTAAWPPNNLTKRSISSAHIFINRMGDSAAGVLYDKIQTATKFEKSNATGHGPAVKGLFLHHELVQPRIKGGQAYHAVGPDPGFTAATYARLALCYLAAAVRKGEWLIPAFHCVLDLGIRDGHDDPQNFDLDAWSDAVSRHLAELTTASPQPVAWLLKSDALKSEPTLEAVASGHSRLIPSQTRSTAVARVQRTLNLLAQTTPAYGIDLGEGDRFAGFYGSKTSQAVSAFQRAHGFAICGEVGSATILALDTSCLAHETGANAVANPTPLLVGALPVEAPRQWHTGPGFAQDAHDKSKGWAKTSGIRGPSQNSPDGAVVLTGEETLEAMRGSKHYGPLVARQRRVILAGVHEIEQDGYCLDGRKPPNARFVENHPALTGPGVRNGYSTRFGKSDDMDEGTGSQHFGIPQTCSEICGCSVRGSILTKWLGEQYTTDPRRLTAMVEVYFPRKRRYARLPLIDVGPAETARADIDLSWAADQFLGADGGDDVTFRLDPASIT